MKQFLRWSLTAERAWKRTVTLDRLSVIRRLPKATILLLNKRMITSCPWNRESQLKRVTPSPKDHPMIVNMTWTAQTKDLGVRLQALNEKMKSFVKARRITSPSWSWPVSSEILLTPVKKAADLPCSAEQTQTRGKEGRKTISLTSYGHLEAMLLTEAPLEDMALE